MALTPGTKAPAFSLPSTSGGEVSLAKLKGKKVVLYFYPRDSTPGCTIEACDFRDNLARVKAAGAEVFGVSKDSLESHEKFRGKYSLPFPLLSDADNEVATAFGAYGKKLMYGKPVVGTIRSTFVIDEQGKIEHVWSPVRVAGHVDKVLAALRGEQAPDAKSASAGPAKRPAKAKPKMPAKAARK
jgi:thioredoxin-dependent peroxiredoxin